MLAGDASVFPKSMAVKRRSTGGRHETAAESLERDLLSARGAVQPAPTGVRAEAV
jgi:hypothetical protein